MFTQFAIKLDFSLLEEFATAASKQFKIIERCMALSINSELETPLKFPSKQMCLEIMSNGFGFADYKQAKSDRQREELRSFKLSDELLEKLFYRHNSDIDVGAGFYALIWLNACKHVFQNTFCLNHATLGLYNEMKIAKFTNYALVYQVYPYSGLISNAIGEVDNRLCESEDSLFLLNMIALLLENEKISWSERIMENGGEKTVQFKYSDLYRAKPKGAKGREQAIDYASSMLFEAQISVFFVQVVNSANPMQCEYAMHFIEEAYQALNHARKAGRVMQWCKEALDENIASEPQRFGFEEGDILDPKKNYKYRALYRKMMVSMEILTEDESKLTRLSERIFDYRTQYAVSQAMAQSIKDQLSKEVA